MLRRCVHSTIKCNKAFTWCRCNDGGRTTTMVTRTTNDKIEWTNAILYEFELFLFRDSRQTTQNIFRPRMSHAFRWYFSSEAFECIRLRQLKPTTEMLISSFFLRYEIIFDVWIKRQTKEASPRRQTKPSETQKLIDEQQQGQRWRRRRRRQHSIRFQSEWKAKKSWQVFGFYSCCWRNWKCRPFSPRVGAFFWQRQNTAQQPNSNV